MHTISYKCTDKMSLGILSFLILPVHGDFVGGVLLLHGLKLSGVSWIHLIILHSP